MPELFPLVPSHRPCAPQWFGSVLLSTQLPPQFTWPPGHETLQAPLEQTLPPVQTAPAPEQAPQWLGSFCVLMQVPLQEICPVGQQMPSESVSLLGHLHAPPWQVWPPVHAVPELFPLVPSHLPFAPQWIGSVSPSTQLPPQFTWLPGHDTLQAPLEQTLPPVQTELAPEQAPQWLGSFCVFTQTPPHEVWPAGQQMPLESAWPLGHLHAPL